MFGDSIYQFIHDDDDDPAPSDVPQVVDSAVIRRRTVTQAVQDISLPAQPVAEQPRLLPTPPPTTVPADEPIAVPPTAPPAAPVSTPEPTLPPPASTVQSPPVSSPSSQVLSTESSPAPLPSKERERVVQEPSTGPAEPASPAILSRSSPPRSPRRSTPETTHQPRRSTRTTEAPARFTYTQDRRTFTHLAGSYTPPLRAYLASDWSSDFTDAFTYQAQVNRDPVDQGSDFSDYFSLKAKVNRDPDTLNWAEAMRSDEKEDWLKAAAKEVEALETHGT